MRETKLIAGLPGYPPEIGAALWQLEDAKDRTLRLLDDMPAGYVDRDVRGNSIGTILYHLALIETDWLCAASSVVASIVARHRWRQPSR